MPAPSPPPQQFRRKEVAPFGVDAFYSGGLPLIENPDPVLSYLAEEGEEIYRLMERSEAAISSARGQRTGTLLSAGSRVEVGTSGTKDAEDLKDWAVHALKQIRRWHILQRRSLDAIYWGWRPIHLQWQESMWRGRLGHTVVHAREKRSDRFRFTPDRDLAYTGEGRETNPQIFRTEADRLRWLVCTAGSNDNPYGDPLFAKVWLIWHTKQRFLEMWASGMARSMGILKASQNGAALQTAAKELIDPQTAGKGIAEIAAELRDILGHMAGSQLLIEKAGWILELLENVRYADGWKHPLEYCDELIRLAITHESLTMTVGDVGSKAAAETHRKGLIDLAKSDGKEQESWINDGLLDPMLRWNFGDINEEDKPRWRTLLGREIQPEKVTAISMEVSKSTGRPSPRRGMSPCSAILSPARFYVVRRPSQARRAERMTPRTRTTRRMTSDAVGA